MNEVLPVEMKNGELFAIQHIDNWDGEGEVLYSIAVFKNGSLFLEESGKPVLEYVGDKILNLWPLNKETAQQYSEPSHAD